MSSVWFGPDVLCEVCPVPKTDFHFMEIQRTRKCRESASTSGSISTAVSAEWMRGCKAGFVNKKRKQESGKEN